MSPSSRGPLHSFAGPEAVAQHVELLVDKRVWYVQRVDLGLQGGELGQLELGAYVDLGRELDKVAVLELGDLDVRLGQGRQVVFGDSRAIEVLPASR